ncbi:MAG: radical SAM family heme chaperone HemW [Bacteroidota bacterium]
MAGIYIHIPFCKKACHYCNFHFSTSTKQIEPLVECLLKEIGLRKDYTKETIETIYFGGGTPSILSAEQILKILQAVKDNYIVSNDAEITLESNPDDIDPDKLLQWKEMGINRLSIGIQSFREDDLLWMNRAHNASQAYECIKLAQEYGFNNITIDLIYGVPNLSDEHWKENINTALSLNIPHLSCYALTVEPKTALDKLIQTKKKEAVDTDKQATHFLILMEALNNAGFEHYEISNFAIPGYRSKHNSSYWQGKHYVGIGPSAHSFNGDSRQWNVANNALYIQAINNNILPSEKEILTPHQQFNEYVMTALRTIDGIDLNYLTERYGNEKFLHVKKEIIKWKEQGLAQVSEKNIKLTSAGKLMADGIASDLFII